MIPQHVKKEIRKSFGYDQTDSMEVRFFNHETPDMNNKSIIEAKKKADMIAENQSNITGTFKAPDYSPQNLIRLGAKQSYKTELYVEIKRLGAKDFRSMKAEQSHKEQFTAEYETYLQENKNDDIKASDNQRPIIQPSTNRQDNNPTCTSFDGGNFSYTFNI